MPAVFVRAAYATDNNGSASASTRKDRTLVILQMAGGNDGLNTVVPYTDSQYYSLRKNISLAPVPDDEVNGREHVRASLDEREFRIPLPGLCTERPARPATGERVSLRAAEVIPSPAIQSPRLRVHAFRVGHDPRAVPFQRREPEQMHAFGPRHVDRVEAHLPKCRELVQLVRCPRVHHGKYGSWFGRKELL